MTSNDHTLIVYPLEGSTYPFDWVEPEEDAPYTYLGVTTEEDLFPAEFLYDDDYRREVEEYDRWAAQQED